MEKFFESLFCSNRPETLCEKHIKSPIVFFCLADDCTEPLLCLFCKDTHAAAHKQHQVVLKDLFNGQIQKRINKSLAEFDVETLEKSRQSILQSLNLVKEELNKTIGELAKFTNKYFDAKVAKSQRLTRQKEEFDILQKLTFKTNQGNTTDYKRGVELFSKLCDGIDELNNENPVQLGKEINKEIVHAKDEIMTSHFAELQEIFQRKTIDFNKLKPDFNIKIPGSQGVGLEACAYIEDWNFMVVGYKEDGRGSLAVYDLKHRNLVTIKKDVHSKVIIHVIWIPSKSLISTCSHDSLIKLFKVRGFRAAFKMDCITVLRGHNDWIRCLSYLPAENLLVTAGTSPDIKLWNIERSKRSAIINTNFDGDLDGTLAYIEHKRLIGAGFKTGYIRFYHIIMRTVQFMIPTGYSNYYCSGLQYLPKKKLIVAHVYYNTTKVWSFDDLRNVAKEKHTIVTNSSVTGCIMVNEEENQLLMTSVGSYVEIFDMARPGKPRSLSLGPHISKTKAPLFLKNMGGVSICDLTSDTICILKNQF